MAELSDTRRFELVMMPHLNAAYNLARWLTRNEQDAEDIVQESYLRAFKFFHGFRGEHGRAWLLGIVRNTCYTWRQKNQAHMHASYDEESADPEIQSAIVTNTGPESILARRDDLRILKDALSKLPMEFREVVVLRDLEDFSYKEIAEIAEIPIGTVMSRLARGRKLLLAHLMQVKQGVYDGM